MDLGGNLYRFRDRAVIASLIDGNCSVEGWFRHEATTLKTNANKTTTNLFKQGNRRYFGKRYQSHGFVRDLLRRDRALRVYLHSLTLEQAGLPIARPLAYIREGRWKTLALSYFVCEALEDMQDLRYLADAEEGTELLEDENFFLSMAGDLARLHQLGYCHGDMKWANIMVDARTREYRFVDLDGLHKPLSRQSALYAKDLARFIMNAREKKLAESMIDKFVGSYARARSLEIAALNSQVSRSYDKLLRRHRRQYGVDY
jgi:3-deoxy-D-manno-octulosonic acid kinase